MARSKTINVVALVLLGVFGVAGNYFRLAQPQAGADLELSAITISAAVSAGYTDEPLEDDFLDVLKAREVIFRTYMADDSRPVWLFAGYFDRQKEGSQVHSPKHCYPGSGWSILEEQRRPAPWGEGSVASLVVGDGFEKRPVYYWFQTPRSVLTDVFKLKLAMTRNAIARRPQNVVFIRLSTSYDGTKEDAARRLSGYCLEIEKEVRRLYVGAQS